MSKSSQGNSAPLFRIAIILTSALFGLLVAQSMASHFPKLFRSTVTLQIKNDPPGRPFEAESELIQRKEILYSVIDSLDLLKVPRFSKSASREAIYFKLREELSITQVRNTELIQISITDPDPLLAASLANAVATEYQRKANTEQTEESSIDLETLKSEIAQQKAKTEALRVSADQIRSEAGPASERYLAAENNYAMALKILNAAGQRLQNEKISSKGNHSAVTIWEKAEPSSITVSSPPILRLALGALLGAFAGALLSLFIRR